MEQKAIKKGVDCIGISVVYFCHDGKGNFILAKRSANARDEQGKWDNGGGGVEFGDTVENTLKKEIKEEYCTDVLDFEFLGFRDVRRNHQGQPTHWVALDFKVLVDPKMVKNGEPYKLDDIQWFRLESMPPFEQCHSQWPEFLRLYRHRL